MLMCHRELSRIVNYFTCLFLWPPFLHALDYGTLRKTGHGSVNEEVEPHLWRVRTETTNLTLSPLGEKDILWASRGQMLLCLCQQFWKTESLGKGLFFQHEFSECWIGKKMEGKEKKRKGWRSLLRLQNLEHKPKMRHCFDSCWETRWVCWCNCWCE